MKKEVKMIFSMLTLHPEFTCDFNMSNDISTDINCKYVDVCMFCNPWCAVLLGVYLLFTSCGNTYPPGTMNTNLKRAVPGFHAVCYVKGSCAKVISVFYLFYFCALKGMSIRLVLLVFRYLRKIICVLSLII